MAARVMTPNSS